MEYNVPKNRTKGFEFDIGDLVFISNEFSRKELFGIIVNRQYGDPLTKDWFDYYYQIRFLNNNHHKNEHASLRNSHWWSEDDIELINKVDNGEL